MMLPRAPSAGWPEQGSTKSNHTGADTTGQVAVAGAKAGVGDCGGAPEGEEEEDEDDDDGGGGDNADDGSLGPTCSVFMSAICESEVEIRAAPSP